MAQHERRCDQRGSDENPRYARPRHHDCQAHLAAALPGVPAASARATNLSPDSAGMLTRRHSLTPRQPVEYCKNRRELGIRCGQLVGYATQGPLLPCTQAHSRHLRQAVPGRCTRSGSLVLLSPTSSRRLTESSANGVKHGSRGGPCRGRWTGNHADFGHERLAFTEPVARQPDHLLQHPVPRRLAYSPAWHICRTRLRSRSVVSGAGAIICMAAARGSSREGRTDYLFGGVRVSVGAVRRCGLPALCAASGL